MDKVDRIEHPFRVTGAATSTKRRKRSDEDFREYLEDEKQRGSHDESEQTDETDSPQIQQTGPDHPKESPDKLLASLDTVDIRLKDVHRFTLHDQKPAEKHREETDKEQPNKPSDDAKSKHFDETV